MKRLGLALSGGGVRATVFHLGLLKWLADHKKLEDVTFISTVSGGSLCVGLLYTLSKGHWPTSKEFSNKTLAQCRKTLTEIDIERRLKVKSLLPPWRVLKGRANILADILEDQWGVETLVCDLPEHPRWIINATCFETGKNWRFMYKRMGDYVSNYVLRPEIKLSHAIAASAAVPGLIGSLQIKTNDYKWSRFIDGKTTEAFTPQYEFLHLWDGGVYENLGLEPLFKGNKIARSEFDYLIVSDASAPLLGKQGRLRFSTGSALRLMDIATSQIRSLRSRSVIDFFTSSPGSGIFLRIGNTSDYIVRSSKKTNLNVTSELKREEVKKAGLMETTLRKLAPDEFDLLVTHGWEVMDTTVKCYGSP